MINFLIYVFLLLVIITVFLQLMSWSLKLILKVGILITNIDGQNDLSVKVTLTVSFSRNFRLFRMVKMTIKISYDYFK